MARKNERTHSMSVLKDIVNALKSKRVILAAVTAIIVATNQQLGYLDEDMITKITALAASIIVGDSLRPTNPDKAK